MVTIVTNCGKLPQVEAEVSTAAGRVSLAKNDDNHKQNRLARKTLRELIKKRARLTKFKYFGKQLKKPTKIQMESETSF